MIGHRKIADGTKCSRVREVSTLVIRVWVPEVLGYFPSNMQSRDPLRLIVNIEY